VLRSMSTEPYILEHQDLIHKIGVTGGRVESRIANAQHESTYLLADVEVVATYKLAGINRVRMENLFHRLFAAARLDITSTIVSGTLFSQKSGTSCHYSSLTKLFCA